MRKILLSALILTLILSFPTTSHAQPPSVSSSGEKVREEVRERIQSTKQKIEEKRATREARLTEKRKEIIRFFWERLKTRINATVDRLEKLIERIESRLAKIKEKNPQLDTSNIHKDLDNAKAELKQQQIKIEELETGVDATLASGSPKQTFAQVRDNIFDIKNSLIEVHVKLVHIITRIKGLRVGVE